MKAWLGLIQNTPGSIALTSTRAFVRGRDSCRRRLREQGGAVRAGTLRRAERRASTASPSMSASAVKNAILPVPKAFPIVAFTWILAYGNGGEAKADGGARLPQLVRCQEKDTQMAASGATWPPQGHDVLERRPGRGWPRSRN